MTRNIRILRSRLQDRSLFEAFLLLKKAFFKKEQILIYCKELDPDLSFPGKSPFENSIVKGEQSEVERARKAMVAPPWEFCCDLYDGVKDFFIYKDKGIIGHISWIYYKNDPNRIIELRHDEAEIKFSLTLAEYRGKGIYPATLLRIQQYLKEKGYQRAYICATKENISSTKGIEKAGFELIVPVNLIKIAGIQLSKRYAADH